jgi:hypothetical protein
MFCITGIKLSTDIILTVYSIYKARKQRDKCCFRNGINISDVYNILRKSLRFYERYKLMLCITGIQLSADISLTVYSLCRARKQRDSVVFKCINISDINIEKVLVYVSSTTPTAPTVQTRDTRVRCKRELYQICIKACQNCYKNCYNCETIEI